MCTYKQHASGRQQANIGPLAVIPCAFRFVIYCYRSSEDVLHLHVSEFSATGSESYCYTVESTMHSWWLWFVGHTPLMMMVVVSRFFLAPRLHMHPIIPAAATNGARFIALRQRLLKTRRHRGTHHGPLSQVAIPSPVRYRTDPTDSSRVKTRPI